MTYQNGLLTIAATNSTLSDILHSVAMRTGATVDAPPHLMGERVAARIGPGTPRAVLSDLLTGPRFDYILVGPDGAPNAVSRIILTPSQSSGSAGTAVAQQQPPARPVPQEDTESDEEVEERPFPASENPQPARQSPPGPRPFMPPGPPDEVGAQPVTSPEGANQQQPQVKTPEQLLQQLRRMQQQGNPNQPQR